jgi:AcrR family transcriptional regulator
MSALKGVSRPSAEQPSDRRDQLLRIAARLIAARGYSGTTVRDIADEAGILSGSLYHHFSSKEAILDEILRSFMEPLLERFVQIEAGGGAPRETLDQLIDYAFSTIESSPDFVALYQNESSFLARQPGFEFVAETSARIEEIWLRTIRRGQADGIFQPNLEAWIVYRFLRDSVWSTVRWYHPGGRFSAASVRDNYLSFLHGGLLA